MAEQYHCEWSQGRLLVGSPPLPGPRVQVVQLQGQLSVPGLLGLELGGEALDQEFGLVVDAGAGQFVFELVVLGLQGEEGFVKLLFLLLQLVDHPFVFLCHFPLVFLCPFGLLVPAAFQRPGLGVVMWLLVTAELVLESEDQLLKLEIGPFPVLSVEVDLVDEGGKFVGEFEVADLFKEEFYLGQGGVPALQVREELAPLGPRGRAAAPPGSPFFHYSNTIMVQSEVGVAGEVRPSQEAVQEHLCLLPLVLGDHVAGPLHRGEHQPVQFPDHAAHLVLVLVEAGDPPLPPLVEQLDPELIPEPDQPGHCAGDGDAVVDVALGDPDPEFLLHEDGVEPVAGVLEHDVVVADLVAAGLEFLDVDVEVGLDGPLVEELADAVHVLADQFALHELDLAVGEADVGLVAGVVDLLVEALRVEVQHAGVCLVEFGVHDLPDLQAGLGVVAHGAGPGDLKVLILGVVAVVVEVLVLVDAHVDVVAGLPALARVGAGVVDHDTLEVDPHLSLGQLVGLNYLVGEVGDIDARIALAGYVELVVLEVGELLEELQQGLVVVLRHRPVIMHLPRL